MQICLTSNLNYEFYNYRRRRSWGQAQRKEDKKSDREGTRLRISDLTGMESGDKDNKSIRTRTGTGARTEQTSGSQNDYNRERISVIDPKP